MQQTSTENAAASEAARAKKKQNAMHKLRQHLDVVARMLSTPDFISNYFKSHEGMTFSKVSFYFLIYNYRITLKSLHLKTYF